MRLGSATVTVITGEVSGYDGVGDPKYTPAATPVYGCSLQQHSTKREIGTTDVIESRYRLFAPPTAPLTATSRVVIGVVTLPIPDDTEYFKVDGDPAVWYSASGQKHHIECYLKKEAG